MSKSNKDRVSANPVEILSCFWLEVDGEHKMVTVGMCCRFEDRKGLYRIVGMRADREGNIALLVRKELAKKIGKVRTYSAEDMIWQEPPYSVPY